MDNEPQNAAFISAGEALILATEGRVQLVLMAASTIAFYYRWLACRVGPMRGSMTTPRSGAF
ncbi:MAG: hypothetical protein ACRYG8_48880 [Janthinobacterium lividum]